MSPKAHSVAMTAAILGPPLVDNDLRSFRLVLLLDPSKGKPAPHPIHPAPATKLALLMEDESPCQEGWSLTKGPASHFCNAYASALLGPQNLSLTGHASLLHLLAGDPRTIHYSEKFQLGEPLSVRAVGAGGMGGRERW